MDRLYLELKQYGDVKTNEPMSKHTTFKIGGPAKYFVAVTETESLVELLRYLDGAGEKYFIFGGGSNLLARDRGFDGVVVKVSNFKFQISKNLIEVDAGCITATVARMSVAHGLAGFEWAVGVPGTIGGAVRGNAGATGSETKDVVWEVDAYKDGEVVTYSNEECHLRYRHSRFKEGNEVVLRARLKLLPGDKKEGMKKMLEVLKYRTDTQPKGYASIGCIFKNFQFTNFQFSNTIEIPQEFLEKKRIPAGWLVEQAGMKGARVGGAMVSEAHGNFVVNADQATAAEVLTLIEQVKERVYDRFGVELQEEIQIV